MKKRLLLLVIYLAFISLGLPDSLLGSGWPSMFISFDVPIHYGGIIAMIVASGTPRSALSNTGPLNEAEGSNRHAVNRNNI